MIFNRRNSNFYSFILFTIFISSSTASFCSNLTSIDDKDTPCFLEPPTNNPVHLRSSGSSLVLPCHVARSKYSTVEWWYQDFAKTIKIKIYPVFPAVRPTVLRFITSATLVGTKDSNETDIVDVSVLLRNINIDDSGIYRCVIRPWTPSQITNIDDTLLEDISYLPSLAYHIHLTGPRLCQATLGTLPCFSNMRSSSPTIIDAYKTAFLQCVVHNYNRPVTVMWVIGNASANSVLITDYLATNQHDGDRLRRVFPHSLFDYSLELTVNRDIHERTYSCVIDGTTDVETTLFSYIVRSIPVEEVSNKNLNIEKHVTSTTESNDNQSHEINKNNDHNASETIKINSNEKDVSSIKDEKMTAHDALTPQQVDELRQKIAQEHDAKNKEKSHSTDSEDLLEQNEQGGITSKD